MRGTLKFTPTDQIIDGQKTFKCQMCRGIIRDGDLRTHTKEHHHANSFVIKM